MALSDIPEFVKVATGELIRADNWNQIQRLLRNDVRTHHHTREAGAPVNDAAATDEAQQISGNEIADSAVGSAKLADGAVTAAKMGNSSIATAHIQNNAVTSAKLSFSQVNTGSATIPPGGTVETAVQLAAPSTKSTVYFPVLALVNTTGGGLAEIDAQIIYRQAVGATATDVHIRLRNQGSATTGVLWQVLTFSS